MDYKSELFKWCLEHEREIGYNISNICKYIVENLKKEWIEEEDLKFYRENINQYDIIYILNNMPKLDWNKLAYETVIRKSGTCCHMTAITSYLLSYQHYDNYIVCGYMPLTKGKYANKMGIHYWNKVIIGEREYNIDINNNLILVNNSKMKENGIIEYKKYKK